MQTQEQMRLKASCIELNLGKTGVEVINSNPNTFLDLKMLVVLALVHVAKVRLQNVFLLSSMNEAIEDPHCEIIL